MKNLSLFLVLGAFLLGACERHTWEDNDANGDGIISEAEKGTKRLYPAHHGDEKGHGDEAKKGQNDH